MLEDSDQRQAGHHSDSDHLQADVQPLHGSVAQEKTALVLLQTSNVFLHKPGKPQTVLTLFFTFMNKTLMCKTNTGSTKIQDSILGVNHTMSPFIELCLMYFSSKQDQVFN